MPDRPEPIADDPRPGGVPWADGQVTLRVRPPAVPGSGPVPGRIVRSRGPVVLVGRHPAAEVRIPHRAASPRHLLLVLDRRGVFAVDLLSRSGTRVAGRPIATAWLGVGEAVELAGHRIEILRLRADGAAIDPVPPGDEVDPFAPALGVEPLALHPEGDAHPPWVVGSALVLLGRSEACALRLRDAAAAPIHAAIWREPGSVHLVDLAGRRTRVNGHAVAGPVPLQTGVRVELGLARFAVQVGDAPPALPPARVDRPIPVPALGNPATPPAVLSRPEPGLGDVMDLLRQFQSDAATLIEGQFDQIDALRRELAALRDDIQASRPVEPEAPPPFAISPTRADTPADRTEAAAWLLDRIASVEPGPDQRPRWRDLAGRIAAAIGRAEPAQDRPRAIDDLKPSDPSPQP